MSRFRQAWTLLVLVGGAGALAAQWMTLRELMVEADPVVELPRRAVEADLRGEDSVRQWMEAWRHAPRSASIGVNAALALERAGRAEEAEKVLLETARVNRLWLPRWSLTSFYWRQGRREEVRRWGRLALERSYAGVRPALFVLLGEAGIPSREWLEWGGDAEEIVAEAVEFLGARGDFEELAEAAGRMAEMGPGRAPVLWRETMLRACSSLVVAGSGAAAVKVWNALVARGASPFSPIGAFNRIGNPGFVNPMDATAFNWQFPRLQGVSRTFGALVGSVLIRFDGSQPEHSELLSAAVWLEPFPHRFSCAYRMEGTVPAGTGPVWKIGGTSSAPLEVGGWRAVLLEVAAAPVGRMTRLSLDLDRKAGFMRTEGAIELRDPKLVEVR